MNFFQAGIIAAAGLLALEESPKRLHEDHEKARNLALGIAGLPGIALDPEKVVTNIVIFDVAGTGKSGPEICEKLRGSGVLAGGFGTSIRMVTHCDVTSTDIANAVDALGRTLMS